MMRCHIHHPRLVSLVRVNIICKPANIWIIPDNCAVISNTRTSWRLHSSTPYISHQRISQKSGNFTAGSRNAHKALFSILFRILERVWRYPDCKQEIRLMAGNPTLQTGQNVTKYQFSPISLALSCWPLTRAGSAGLNTSSRCSSCSARDSRPGSLMSNSFDVIKYKLSKFQNLQRAGTE